MDRNTLKVTARITAVKGKENDLKNVLVKLIEPTRQEQGCISYELLHNNSDATDFIFIEKWKSEADLEAHMQSNHFQEAAGKLTDLIATDPDIQRYHTIEIG